MKWAISWPSIRIQGENKFIDNNGCAARFRSPIMLCDIDMKEKPWQIVLLFRLLIRSQWQMLMDFRPPLRMFTGNGTRIVAFKLWHESALTRTIPMVHIKIPFIWPYRELTLTWCPWLVSQVVINRSILRFITVPLLPGLMAICIYRPTSTIHKHPRLMWMVYLCDFHMHIGLPMWVAWNSVKPKEKLSDVQSKAIRKMISHPIYKYWVEQQWDKTCVKRRMFTHV